MRWDEQLHRNTLTHVPLPLVQVKSTVAVPIGGEEVRGRAEERGKRRVGVQISFIYINNDKTNRLFSLFNRVKIIGRIISSLVNRTPVNN